MTKPFRFGVQAKTATSRSEWIESAKKAEDLGYATLTIPDHFDGQLAPALALQAAADATDTLRVGALVWCNDYRHPVVFANEMATLDLLSDGRLELGIGAGWMKSDYDAAGMTYDRPGIRIDRMIDYVKLARQFFAGEQLDMATEHVTANSMAAAPLLPGSTRF